MLWFNYEKLFIASRGDCATIIKLLQEKATTGINWIINDYIVLQNTQGVSIQQLAEYVGLCSLRKYSDYTVYGNKDLDLECVPPWIPSEVIYTNPLLKVTNKQIIFIYEETETCLTF